MDKQNNKQSNKTNKQNNSTNKQNSNFSNNANQNNCD